jgi:hypothetical protein
MEPGSREGIHALLDTRPPGESIKIAKSKMVELPSGFELTLLGTPLWIAHPGATAQYRASPALHAYELENRWEVHRDRFDPHEDPVGHFLFDAPELAFAAVAAAIAGLLAYRFLDRMEKKQPEESRNWWLPGLIAIGIALAIGIVAYIIGALVRVASGVG